MGVWNHRAGVSRESRTVVFLQGGYSSGSNVPSPLVSSPSYSDQCHVDSWHTTTRGRMWLSHVRKVPSCQVMTGVRICCPIRRCGATCGSFFSEESFCEQKVNLGCLSQPAMVYMKSVLTHTLSRLPSEAPIPFWVKYKHSRKQVPQFCANPLSVSDHKLVYFQPSLVMNCHSQSRLDTNLISLLIISFVFSNHSFCIL